MNQEEIIDRYFLEHRAKVIDIAAFLDRVDRCKDDGNDFRIEALHRCIEELSSDMEGRAERILLLLSDLSTNLVAEAGTQGAIGVVPPTP